MKAENTKTKRGRPAGQSRCECQLIGYLTRPALKAQLNALVAAGTIGHWWAVQHEPDEDSRKEHWHLRMTPPASGTVNWSEVVAGVEEMVEGETLPRRLVLDKRGVNDKREDGLLYARHDARYLDAKGETRTHLDYPREAFMTDSEEWLDALWAESDRFTPTAKRMTAEDLCEEVERNPDISDRALLRACLVNGLNKGIFELLILYRLEVRRARVAMPRPTPSRSDETPFPTPLPLPTPTPADEQPTLWDEWPSTPSPTEPWEE